MHFKQTVKETKVAIWSFLKPNHPNLAFLKIFARNKMV